MTDYVGAFLATPKDVVHYGRKGMKWGQRIFTKRGESDTGKTDAGSAASKATGSASAPAKRPPGNIQDNVESSSQRYARLAGQAKAGQAGAMTEQDLKFFNARTDALAKINKMNEVKPSWLRETATNVIRQSAQRQMQTVADAVADKYVGGPLKAALGGSDKDGASGPAKTAAASAVATSAAAVASKAAGKTVGKTAAPKPPGMTPEQSVQYFRDRPASTVGKTASPRTDLLKELDSLGLTAPKSTSTTTSPSKMRFDDALKYYQDNPSETPVAPEGYSPRAAQLFLDQVRNKRGN